MNANQYIIVRVVFPAIRRKRQHHCAKNNGEEKRPQKDKPLCYILHRTAKFARDFSRSKFGFFYDAQTIKIFTTKPVGIGCRDPPSINRFDYFQIH